jgi:hypothetical protein
MTEASGEVVSVTSFYNYREVYQCLSDGKICIE